MHAIMRYPSGRRVEAIVLAADSERMRIVLRRTNETIELRQVDGNWFGESGETLEIEALVSDGRAILARPARPRVRAAC